MVIHFEDGVWTSRFKKSGNTEAVSHIRSVAAAAIRVTTEWSIVAAALFLFTGGLSGYDIRIFQRGLGEEGRVLAEA